MSLRSSSWLVLVFLAASLSLSGCLGNSVNTAQCSKFTDTQKDDCIYFLAVWSLSPETCYQISSSSVRESCLMDSNDADASRALQDRWYASGTSASKSGVKTAPPIPTKAVNNTTAPKPVAPPPVDEALADTKIAKCVASTKETSDACARQLAIDGRDLGYCVKVISPDLRQSCILTVASNLKDLAACEMFKSSADRQFCVYYSRGN